MTSEERHERRYIRRRQRREAKRIMNTWTYNRFDKVFTYANMWRAWRECRKGVYWKASVQRYSAVTGQRINATLLRLYRGSFRSKGFFSFDLNERGKIRHIRSVCIEERVVQRTLCDNSLVPMLTRRMIYDNGASQKGKGYHFAIRRMRKHLTRHFRRHGVTGYILLFDFKGYFDSIPHDVVKRLAGRYITDPGLVKLMHHFIDCFNQDQPVAQIGRGLGLGSQISQTLALLAGDPIDHMVKEQLRINGYGRYMDDGYLIHESKEYLRYCLERIKALADALGLRLNLAKTCIVKLTHGFTWCKKRVRITETGRIVMKLARGSAARERRKLRKLKARGIPEETLRQSYASWEGYARWGDNWKTIQSMRGELTA